MNVNHVPQLEKTENETNWNQPKNKIEPIRELNISFCTEFFSKNFKHLLKKTI